MGVQATSKVWSWSLSEGNNRLVLLALADWADDEGYCWPGIKRIAGKCRISERTVQRCIRELEKAGELTVQENVGIRTDSGFTNRYQITIKPPGVKLSPDDKNAVSGDKSGIKGVSAVSPNPSVDTSVKPLDTASPKAKRFQKPLKTEVEEYGENIRLAKSEVEAFWDYQESKGWKVGNAPMKDFEAAMRTWKRNADKFGSKGFQKPGAARPASNPDSVWQGDIWLLCDERRRGETHDIAHVRRKLEKACSYAKPGDVAEYIMDQIKTIPHYWYQILTDLGNPGEGKKAA